MNNPLVGIIMGSESDLSIMSGAAELLDQFGITNEVRIISAHRTPAEMSEYAHSAQERGLQVIIAGAGGSAHLPGMTASETTLPVIAIPVKKEGSGNEAFWSNIKMPPGIPLATMPENGAKNGALLAIRILALHNDEIAQKYKTYINEMHDNVTKSDQNIQEAGWRSIIES